MLVLMMTKEIHAPLNIFIDVPSFFLEFHVWLRIILNLIDRFGPLFTCFLVKDLFSFLNQLIFHFSNLVVLSLSRNEFFGCLRFRKINFQCV